MEVKDQVKARLSIVDVASLYVNLKPAGKNYKALCPFHSEKTPSFFVMPEKGTFSCYGCNKFGDMFTLIQEMENLSFPESINFLVDRFSIPVERTDYKPRIKKDDYVHINEAALKYFMDNLYRPGEGKDALDYLLKRGITEETITEFSLGYAYNAWDGLHRHLAKGKFNIDKSVENGLLVKKGPGKVYDRFRGRIIIPIFSETGAIIAFGGRTMFNEPSKYLNSPDTPLYKKSKNLFGFNTSKQHIRKANSVVIVEGYFDMIAMYQQGVKNTVASLGTALTAEQIQMLKRFSDELYLFYDSDKAGVTAAVRGIEKMFEQNVNPRILMSPDTKDPDDYIRAHGVEGFEKLQQEAYRGFKFLLDKASQDFDLRIPERKRDAVEFIKTFLLKMSDEIIRGEYSRMAADFLDVDPMVFRRKQANLLNKSASNGTLAITPAEREFIEAIMASPSLIKEVKDYLNDEMLSVLACGNMIKAVIGHYNEQSGEIEDYKGLLDCLNDAEKRELNRINSSVDCLGLNDTELSERLGNSFLQFQEKLNRLKLKELDREIKIKAKENKYHEVEELMALKSKFVQTMHKKN
jgi:DNA primase